MNTRQPIAESIVEISREIDELRGQRSEEAEARRTVLYEQLQLIGATANYFGGFAAMKRLHDEAESLVGETNDVGFNLNRAWDMIGSWMA